MLWVGRAPLVIWGVLRRRPESNTFDALAPTVNDVPGTSDRLFQETLTHHLLGERWPFSDVNIQVRKVLPQRLKTMYRKATERQGVYC